MATTKLYLDKRRAKNDSTYPLKVSINVGKDTALLPLNIHLKANEWNDTTMQVVGRNDRQFLNTFIAKRKSDIDCIILRLFENDELHRYTAKELRDYIESLLNGTQKRKGLFAPHFLDFAQQHSGRTLESYMVTYRHIERFAGNELNSLTFDNITRAWLLSFNDFLSKTSPSQNARNISLRYIRAVFNDAIDNGLTTNYPFRKFSLTPQPTAHRTLTLEQLRYLFNYTCKDWQRQYVDMFKLIFFLCGINIVDLYSLKEIVNGRIEYYRAKTHKLYSIKVEPEAQEIIDKYRGQNALLNMADHCANHRYYAVHLNAAIQKIKGFENITTYYMRHTWATIAAELDIPFDTISLALGHSAGGARVTQVYINFNNRKIDEANRKVIDYVLYGK